MNFQGYCKTIFYVIVVSIPMIFSCGTETTNECSSYVIYMPDGITPASGTHVSIVSRKSISGNAGAAIVADRNGSFQIPDTLSPGVWSVMFTCPDIDTLAAWQELVKYTSGEYSFHNDTLESAGTVSGIVQLHEHDREYLEAVVIRLLGTTRAVNADSNGHFCLYQIPGGMFTLQCTVPSKLENYGELNKSLLRPNGNDTILTDTLKLPYIGFPYAENLSAQYDSLAGIVHLSWDKYDDGYNAMILRTRKGSNVVFDTIGVVDNSVFDDTLYSNNKAGTVTPFSQADSTPFILEYRIRLCRKNYNCGDFWENVKIRVFAPLKSYKLINTVQNLSHVYDSLLGVVKLRWDRYIDQPIKSYLIYKNFGDSISVHAVNDTLFTDTLFKCFIGNEYNINLTRPITAKYEVRCIGREKDTGVAVSTGAIRFSSPAKVASILNFEGCDFLPGFWGYSAFDYTLSSSFELVNNGHNSDKCLHLWTRDSVNDIRCQLTVTGLEIGATYLITCWIKSKDVSPEILTNTGAALWVNENLTATSPVIIGSNDWTKCACTFKAENNFCRIWCRLGAYGNRMTGEVWFDDISIEKLY